MIIMYLKGFLDTLYVGRKLNSNRAMTDISINQDLECQTLSHFKKISKSLYCDYCI